MGYYIGQNTKLQELNFYITIDNESFYKEIIHNKSIKEIQFYGINLLDGKVFRMLNPFLKNNHSLTQISVQDSEFGEESARQLSLALGDCSQLKNINISENIIGIGQLVNIITALSMHPQLERLDLTWMDIDRNECTALSTLLRCTTTQLQKLNLHGNNIDDDGIELLLPALCEHTLQELKLGYNHLITIIGWKAVSTLLETPDSNLETLNISFNNIGDDEARIFANALKSNTTLKTLSLSNSRIGITSEGWAPFSKLLCDTSSINNTFLSNHTLENFGNTEGQPRVVSTSFVLNNMEDKRKVAITKILRQHSHFNVQPFFEWELKVLPIMINWFTKAATFALPVSDTSDKINKLRLSVIYDFIKALPMLYVEPMTRQEIAKYTAIMEEEQLQGDELEEIRQRKAHAMRRL